MQRGLLRWVLALHSPSHSFSISPEKVGGSREPDANDVRNDELPSVVHGDNPERMSVLPTTSVATDDLIEIPPAVTPSIKKTLRKPGVGPGKAPAPLPPGLDVATLKSRLEGKKKIK